MPVDKLQDWEERISNPPKAEVANLDYMDLLRECRIIEEEQ